MELDKLQITLPTPNPIFIPIIIELTHFQIIKLTHRQVTKSPRLPLAPSPRLPVSTSSVASAKEEPSHSSLPRTSLTQSLLSALFSLFYGALNKEHRT